MRLDKLHIASELLRVAIDRYANACISLKQSLASDCLPLQGPIGSRLTGELSMLAGYETKLRNSRAAISQSANRCSDVVPLCRVPDEILVHIFQLLVDMCHPSSPQGWEGVPTYPLRLTHVCTAWRHIVRESPSLWSRIMFYSNPNASKKLETYIDFYSGRAKEATMDVTVLSGSTPEGPEAKTSSGFMIPTSFTGRIRSLAARLFIPRNSTDMTDGEALLAKCLESSNNRLRRFALNMIFEPQPPENYSEANTSHSLCTGLSHDQLEAALSPITDLWLKGVYFKWASKAYHGLVSLRLDCDDSRTIPEIHFMSILESSPRLEHLSIELTITRTSGDPDLLPVYLPHLKLLVGSASLLRLVRPGSNELTVTIIDSEPQSLYDPTVKGFFACANLVSFYSKHFFSTISDICHLLSIAPRLRGLALSRIKLEGILPDVTPYNLDTLYLLRGSELEWPFLEDMADLWAIRRVVFGHTSCRIYDKGYTIPYLQLEKELSYLSTRGVQLEVVRHDGNWTPPMDLFVGPPFKE